MKDKIAEFGQISLLNKREVLALENILDNEKLFSAAQKIAEKEFFPAGNTADLPQLTAAELSQAWFAAAFLSFDLSRQCYCRLNIPEAVWRDSMTDLAVWLRNEERNSGIIGLGALARPWQVVIYQGKVTRHGRLECNTEFYYSHDPLYDDRHNLLLTAGDAVINLHIPEDGAMDMASCSDSIRRMAEFFARYRPDYNWKGFLCESWLLDRQLRPMLPEKSNIIKFQNLGLHYMLHPTDDTIFRIFGTADPFKIPNPTSLQKNAAAFIQHGGTFYEEGIFIPRSQIEELDFDLNRLLQARAAITRVLSSSLTDNL